MYNLQLRYYNPNIFWPSLGHVQGAHKNYTYKTETV